MTNRHQKGLNLGAMRDRRKAAGLTQEQVAEALGVDSSVVSRMERGLLPVDTERLGRLAQLYHCAIVDFLDTSAFGRDVRPARAVPIVTPDLLRSIARPALGAALQSWTGDRMLISHAQEADFYVPAPDAGLSRIIPAGAMLCIRLVDAALPGHAYLLQLGDGRLITRIYVGSGRLARFEAHALTGEHRTVFASEQPEVRGEIVCWQQAWQPLDLNSQ